MKPENDLALEERVREVIRQSAELNMNARDGKHDKLIRNFLKIRNAADKAIDRLLEIT